MLRNTIIAILLVSSYAQATIVAEAGVGEEKKQPICLPPQSLFWTPWFDRDNPGGNGDYEMLSLLIQEGKPICPKPVGMECQTLSGIPATSTGEIVHQNLGAPSVGCYCVNAEQPDGVCNHDYRVRFLCCQDCPYGQSSYWTAWFDRDNPGGVGDYETLTDLLK